MLSISNRHFAPQSGFTLIELMIAIVIIGIVAEIAIPHYRIYVGKAQATIIIGELAGLRLSVEECLQTGRTEIGLATEECNPHASASNLIIGTSQVGITLSNNMGVARMSNPLTLTSSITATISTPNLAGKKIAWLRSSEGSWSCRSNIEAVYLPNSCPHDASL